MQCDIYVTNEDPNTHIQHGKRINETMSCQPESFTIPNQVVHCLRISCTHTHTSDLQQFEIYQDAIEQSNVQIKPLTQCKQTFSPRFGPKTRAEVSHLQDRMSKPTSIRRVPFYLPFYQRRSGQTLEIAWRQWSVKDGAFQCNLSCPLIDQFHFTSFPFWHMLQHNCLHS
jgi:hypothetical protein